MLSITLINHAYLVSFLEVPVNNIFSVMLKSSRRDIASIKPMYTYLNILGLTPFFDFKTVRVNHKVAQVYLVTIFTVLAIYLAITGIRDMYILHWNTMPASEILFFVICFAIATYTRLISLLKCQLWEEFFKSIYFLESPINLNSRGTLETLCYKRPFFQFLLLLSLVYSACAVNFSFSLWSSCNFFFYRITNFIGITSVAIISSELFKIILQKYSDINNLLLSTKQIPAKPGHCLIRKCRIMYQEMQKLTKIINQLYGGYFLMIFFYSGYKALYLAISMYRWYSLGLIVSFPNSFVRVSVVTNFLDFVSMI